MVIRKSEFESFSLRPGESLFDAFVALRAELNDLRTKYGQLLAKLDADAGVDDTNYAATEALAAATFSTDSHS